MSRFRYRALTENGDVVHGTISAATAKDVIDRIEYLRLLPIETVEEKTASPVTRDMLAWFGGPTQADVTTFTRDLALLLKAGARLEDSLELLAGDADIGRLLGTSEAAARRSAADGVAALRRTYRRETA